MKWKSIFNSGKAAGYTILVAVMLIVSRATYGQAPHNQAARALQKLAPEEQGEQQEIKDITAMAQLEMAGKFREALPFIIKITDSLKVKAANNEENKTKYSGMLKMEAWLYVFSGDYAKAEEILNNILQEDVQANTAKAKSDYQQTHIALEFLYEKMGRPDDNIDLEETTLENLVIAEYAGVDLTEEKKQFLAYYKDMLTKQMSMIRNDLKPLISPSPSTNPTANAVQNMASNYLKSITNEDADTTYLKSAELQWDNYVNHRNQNSQDARSIGMYIGMFRMTRQSQASLAEASPEQLKLLREGKFVFAGRRPGLDYGPQWEQVDKLFSIYLLRKNYTAAEGLIKQAIRIDNLPEETNAYAAYMGYAVMSSMAGFGQQPGMKPIAQNAQQAMTAGTKYGGVNVYYIQNKALLAQLYKETHRETQYRLLSDSIYTLCKKMDTVDNPIIIKDIADTYVKIGRDKEAIAMYQKLLGLDGKKTGGMVMKPAVYMPLKELTKIYVRHLDFADAETALRKTMLADDRPQRQEYADYRETVIDLAKVYEATGRIPLAEQTYSSIMGPYFENIKANFSFLSENEKIDWLNNQVSALDFSTSLLRTDRHATDEFVKQTYNQQLQLKSLVLSDEQKVFTSVRQNGTPQLKKLFASWQSNKKAIAWQYTQPATQQGLHLIDSLNAVANQQEKEINQLSGTITQLRQSQQIGFNQIQQKLSPGEAAIEFIRFNYFHKESTDSVWYAAFVTRPGDLAPHFVPLFEERRIAQLLKGDIKSRQFVEGLYGKTTAVSSGNILYNLIFAPLQQLLKGYDKIDIAPAGLLNNISFKALPANGGYLADMYKEVRVYSSIREIAEQTQGGKPGITNAVLYGGIKYGTADNTIPQDQKTKYTGWVWAPLTGTSSEVNQIDSLFKINKVPSTPMMDYDATEESLKQLSGKSPGILHIATHGFSLPAPDKSGSVIQRGTQFSMAGNPMFRNGLIMANGNKVWSGGLPVAGKEDGILTAYEIANLDLSNTQLVTLSACETALGDIEGTEGTFGLQRAFKLAGVKNMLLSLWDLPDAETVQFMKAFYTNKIVKNMPDCQALKAVQDEFRKTKQPYYWAGFVLIE